MQERIGLQGQSGPGVFVGYCMDYHSFHSEIVGVGESASLERWTHVEGQDGVRVVNALEVVRRSLVASPTLLEYGGFVVDCIFVE